MSASSTPGPSTHSGLAVKSHMRGPACDDAARWQSDARESGEGQASMAEIPISSSSPGGTALQGRQSPRWIKKLVGAIALTVIAVLIAGGVAPFALQEQRSSGSVADTAATLTGQSETASEGCAVSATPAPTPTCREMS
jgi:hypothetical protein